jgi:hypothetical protein
MARKLPTLNLTVRELTRLAGISSLDFDKIEPWEGQINRFTDEVKRMPLSKPGLRRALKALRAVGKEIG